MTKQTINSVTVPVSIGELIDKMTILMIKSERMTDEKKLKNVRHELSLLEEVLKNAVPDSEDLHRLTEEMKKVNIEIWEISDKIHEAERTKVFGPDFHTLSREVHTWNDKRSAVKKEINLLFKSDIVEEKSYVDAA
jgi:hypothetical protein